jgi:hypothetical protein
MLPSHDAATRGAAFGLSHGTAAPAHISGMTAHMKRNPTNVSQNNKGNEMTTRHETR